MMKRVDERLGPPLCRLAALFAKPGIKRHAAAVDSTAKPPQSILFIKLWGLGSLVNLTPALELTRQTYPSSHIVVLTLERNRGLGPLLPFCDEVLYLNDKKGAWGLVQDVPRLRRALLRKRFDAVLDAEFFVHFTALLAFFTRAPRRIGFASPKAARSRLYTDLVPLGNQKHIAFAFASLVSALRGKDWPPGFQARPQLRSSDTSDIADFLSTVTQDRKLVLVNPNASELSLLRRWPREHFATVCDALIEEFNAQIAFIGTGEERDYTESVRALMRHSTSNWCGETDLPKLIELMRRADLVISNDSGPLHLAVAAGAPTLSFFGPETPTLYGPQGPQHRVFYRGIACSPCLTALNNKTSHCRNNVCLQEIGTVEVIEAARTLLLPKPKPLLTIDLQPAAPQ